jgi:hypothetical protein
MSLPTHPEEMDPSEDGSAIERSDSHQDEGEAAAKRAAAEAKAERAKLAQKETKAVTILRVVVLAVILCSAAIVTYLVYTFSRQDEKDNFEASFEVNSRKVVER